jgi:hypothetical protein
MAKAAWRKFGRINGSDLGRMAIKVFICQSCGAWFEGKAPAQCDCGRLAFDRFDSKTEAKRWAQLRLLERAGHISELRRQVPFPLLTVGREGLAVKFATYVADFVYVENGQRITEDSKAKAGISPESALKLRCMEAAGYPVRLTS